MIFLSNPSISNVITTSGRDILVPIVVIGPSYFKISLIIILLTYICRMGAARALLYSICCETFEK